jgi:hypothetical protein
MTKMPAVRLILSPSTKRTTGSRRKATIMESRRGRKSPDVAVRNREMTVDAEEKMASPDAMAAVRTK